MAATRETDNEQAKLWNGIGACPWVDAQASIDRMFKPFEELLLAELAGGPHASILDVGCGTGGTTVAIARTFGSASRAVGVDISEPMIAAARARAERDNVPARFICANAQDHAFEPASVDAIVSRFGVMFFDDPVRAFANLRRAATDDGVLRCIVWRRPEDNPFMTTAERAAAPLLPNLPPRQPDAPGQFGFANAQRVSAILSESGWHDIEMRAIDLACVMPEQELIPYLSKFGPVGRMLQEVDEDTRARVVDTVRTAFAPYVHGDEVRYDAACWMMCARASGS